MTKWDEAVRQVSGQVVKVVTEKGWGTGFIAAGSDELRTVATAYHVMKSAYGKQLTIVSGRREFTYGNGLPGRTFLTARIGKLDAVTVILLHREPPAMPMPAVPILERHEPPLTVGMEVGWLGFPCIADGLCFFSGRVSAIVDDDHFFVDGTAIHGVSGGPAFCITDDGPRIVGSITAYLPNHVEDGPLPGLSWVTHAAAHRDIGVDLTSPLTFSISNRRPKAPRTMPTGSPSKS